MNSTLQVEQSFLLVVDTGAAGGSRQEMGAGSVSNYSLQAVSKVLRPPGPFSCYWILLGGFCDSSRALGGTWQCLLSPLPAQGSDILDHTHSNPKVEFHFSLISAAVFHLDSPGAVSPV